MESSDGYTRIKLDGPTGWATVKMTKHADGTWTNVDPIEIPIVGNWGTVARFRLFDQSPARLGSSRWTNVGPHEVVLAEGDLDSF